MTFEEFKKIIAHGFETGELKTDTELNELDLAIQYAIGEEQSRRNDKKLELTTEEIATLIKKYCGEDVYSRVLSEG